MKHGNQTRREQETAREMAEMARSGAMEVTVPRVKSYLKRLWKEKVVCEDVYPLTLKNISKYSSPECVLRGKYNGINVVVENSQHTVTLKDLGFFGNDRIAPGPDLKEINRIPEYCGAGGHSDKEYVPDSTTENIVESVNIESQDAYEKPVIDGSEKMYNTGHLNDLPGKSKNTFQENARVGDLHTKSEMGDCTSNEGKENPETCHLHLEEAYFVAYGLGCLQISDLFGKDLSLQEVWDLFCETQDDFVEKYIVYHYFRAKGWVVKPATKFGGDFLLYLYGPKYTHASYIVVIEVVNENGCRSSDHSQSLKWIKHIGLLRMAEAAGKEVLLCRVVWPPDVLFKDVHSPNILKKFTIQEVFLKRWISSQEREQQDKEDIGE